MKILLILGLLMVSGTAFAKWTYLYGAPYDAEMVIAGQKFLGVIADDTEIGGRRETTILKVKDNAEKSTCYVAITYVKGTVGMAGAHSVNPSISCLKD